MDRILVIEDDKISADMINKILDSNHLIVDFLSCVLKAWDFYYESEMRLYCAVTIWLLYQILFP